MWHQHDTAQFPPIMSLHQSLMCDWFFIVAVGNTSRQGSWILSGLCFKDTLRWDCNIYSPDNVFFSVSPAVCWCCGCGRCCEVRSTTTKLLEDLSYRSKAWIRARRQFYLIIFVPSLFQFFLAKAGRRNNSAPPLLDATRSQWDVPVGSRGLVRSLLCCVWCGRRTAESLRVQRVVCLFRNHREPSASPKAENPRPQNTTTAACRRWVMTRCADWWWRRVSLTDSDASRWPQPWIGTPPRLTSWWEIPQEQTVTPSLAERFPEWGRFILTHLSHLLFVFFYSYKFLITLNSCS